MRDKGKILIAGGTGFIGLGLAHYLLKQGYRPILMARNHPEEHLDFEFVQWDGHTVGDWKAHLDGAVAVVNLAGKSVDCIKSPDNCDLILRSRVASTQAIGRALKEAIHPPEVWIQMSTAHIYGDPPAVVCTEDSSFGYGLAPVVGRAWEEALETTIPSNVRGVRLRTSFVIGKNGGALGALKNIVRMGLGGKVGDGKQGLSWIHEEDMNRLILACIEEKHFQGAYIASSPNPVSNEDFMRTLRKRMSRKLSFRLPLWLTRFGARFIFRTDPELAIYGRYVRSIRLPDEGFSFKYPDLDLALADLID